MVEKVITPEPNVVDFATLSIGSQRCGKALRSRTACRHCGAVLLDGESEDECSTPSTSATPNFAGRPRKSCAD